MAFKDNFRIEKIYFERLKQDAKTFGTWKADPRKFADKELAEMGRNTCESILMLYRLIGESWNENADRIERVAAELDALKTTAENYHDELNEKIDEVNNYLNNAIKELETRVDTLEDTVEDLGETVDGIESDISDFGGLPSNSSASVGDVLTKGENGNEWTTPSGGGGVFAVGITFEGTPTLDKTAGEIIGAVLNKQIVAIYVDTYEDHSLLMIAYLLTLVTDESYFEFRFLADENGDITTLVFSAETEDDYPTMGGSGS